MIRLTIYRIGATVEITSKKLVGKDFPTDLAIARKRGIEEVAWQEYMSTVKNPQRSLFGL